MSCVEHRGWTATPRGGVPGTPRQACCDLGRQHARGWAADATVVTTELHANRGTAQEGPKPPGDVAVDQALLCPSLAMPAPTKRQALGVVDADARVRSQPMTMRKHAAESFMTLEARRGFRR